MNRRITGISSMATRGLLTDLAADYTRLSGVPVVMEAVGGVDAAKRVQAGEAFDLVVLASDVIARLTAAGQVVAGSAVDLVHSGVSVAVRAGAPQPDIGSEAGLRQALLAASSIGYSTGPSGVALLKLFERWGLAEAIRPKSVQAPPGVPVGSLVADGRVALGFQQLSELIHQAGITVIGPLPDAVQIITTFSAGVCSTCDHPDAARALLAFLASPAASAAKLRHGMLPA